ncbi:uncharacterized protein LOC142980133 [Anticarsia gemmatalis]|uniref:uncharacterized protein LOC142980133 n=1 Tax=Anticarsia gemmatalis TaxID=129554 RepID=UPI003F767697
MKIFVWCLLLCALIEMKTIYGKKKHNKGLGKPDSSWYHIDSWSQYQVPVPVHKDDLKQILLKVAEYKKAEYCPFKDVKKCQKDNSMQEVVAEIVKLNLDKTKSLKPPVPPV